MGLLETAAATLIGGERRITVAARNITNANTPGYKREISYAVLSETQPPGQAPAVAPPNIQSYVLTAQGALTETNNPLDFAINGTARILLRQGNEFFLTRGGQLAISPDGFLADVSGRLVQQATGGDLRVSSSKIEILTDGTVLDGDVPIGSIGLFEPEGLDHAKAISQLEANGLIEASGSEIKQGMLERSNVELSDEMISLMQAQRQVESGAQLVRAYGQLMSQAISTFSRSPS